MTMIAYNPEENYLTGLETDEDTFFRRKKRKRGRKKKAPKAKRVVRRLRRDRRRTAKGKKPLHPGLRPRARVNRPSRPGTPVPVWAPAPIRRKTIGGAPVTRVPASLIKIRGPVTPRKLKEGPAVNKAIQQEMKARQEAQTAKGLAGKVEQEDLKTQEMVKKAGREDQKDEKPGTGLTSAGKGLMWVVAVAGGLLLLTQVVKYSGKPPKST